MYESKKEKYECSSQTLKIKEEPEAPRKSITRKVVISISDNI